MSIPHSETETKSPDLVYVGTFAPIVAHIRHPRMIDRTLCGRRVRYLLRDSDVERFGVCYACQQALERMEMEAEQ